MGSLFSREAISSDCQVVREIQRGDIVMEAKGRVTCSCVCIKSGLILVAVGEAVLSWRIDGTFFREFETDLLIETMVECNSGHFFLAGGASGHDAKFTKIMLTRRIADLPFQSVNNTEEQETAPELFSNSHTITLGTGDTFEGKVLVKIIYIMCLNSDLSDMQPTEKCVLFSTPFVMTYSVKNKTVLNVIKHKSPDSISQKACLLPNLRLILASEKRGLNCLKLTGEAVVMHLPKIVRNLCITAVTNTGYNVFVAGECGRVCRYNALSRQCLNVTQASQSVCRNGIGSLLTCMGVVVAIPKHGKGVLVWDGKCGRELGEVIVSFATLNSSGCCVFGSWLLVVDNPIQGMGFKTLLKLYDMRSWFSEVPWLVSYDSCWSIEYIPPTPQLRDHVESSGPLAGIISTNQQPSGQVILGDQIQQPSKTKERPPVPIIPPRGGYNGHNKVISVVLKPSEDS